MELRDSKRKPWCIVVADDHGPEYVPSNTGVEKASPVQYCGFGEPTTLLQTALHRARRIAAAAQIAVTVREENRARWESAPWYLRPDRHFVSDTRLTSSLTTAAALLSIAADSAKNVVTILPARCYVANEWILASALDQLCRMLPAIPEGVGTLGMIDIDDAVDEDYLVPREGESGGGLAVMGMARRPGQDKCREPECATLSIPCDNLCPPRSSRWCHGKHAAYRHTLPRICIPRSE
jgi:hypothetical protein